MDIQGLKEDTKFQEWHDYNNYGDLCADNDVSRLYIRTKFLKDALMEYAICLDLSWQVVWAYIQPSSFKYLVQKKYKEMEKECTSESLRSQLNCAIAQNATQAKKNRGNIDKI